MNAEEGAFDGMTTFLQKAQPSGGKLQVEILADGEIVVESMTCAEQGTMTSTGSRETGHSKKV